MVTIAQIIELSKPGGVNGYRYLKVNESANSVEGALETLEYIENLPDDDEHKGSNLTQARACLAAARAEFRELVGALQDVALREEWLSALETVRSA